MNQSSPSHAVPPERSMSKTRRGQAHPEEGQGQCLLGLGPGAALPSTDSQPRGNHLSCKLRLANGGWESVLWPDGQP